MVGQSTIAIEWGVDSEYGVLHDVLLCSPDNFRWLPTSSITEQTLADGHVFDPGLARRQHEEMVRCYEEQGVRCHFLAADPALPYQVFSRDSSAATPSGAVSLQPQQPWRRGEQVMAANFYRDAGLPLRAEITAGSIEGGDVMIVEPGCLLIGCCESRTTEAGARQLAGWFEEEGWEVRIEPFPARYVHIDVLTAVLAEKVAALCTEVVSAGLVAWFKGKGFEVIEVPEEEAFTLGVNAIALGAERVLSATGAASLNGALRATGLTVFEVDLSMFTLGGGGPHCLAQALRRERSAR
ncbi:MAG: arginine deiminase [Actinobacteria bacterium]|nr:arginine deiminase [Actinomycetota bacterium]